jgi:hypothetical protein
VSHLRGRRFSSTFRHEAVTICRPLLELIKVNLRTQLNSVTS